MIGSGSAWICPYSFWTPKSTTFMFKLLWSQGSVPCQQKASSKCNCLGLNFLVCKASHLLNLRIRWSRAAIRPLWMWSRVLCCHIWVKSTYQLGCSGLQEIECVTKMTFSHGYSKTVKNPPAMQIWAWPLGREDTLKKEMATHYSILAWRIPWTEEADGL